MALSLAHLKKHAAGLAPGSRAREGGTLTIRPKHAKQHDDVIAARVLRQHPAARRPA